MLSDNIFHNIEYLREAVSKTKITNKTLKPYENSLELQLRIYHFLSNAEGDYNGKKLLIKLINMVEVYRMEDVYTWMSKRKFLETIVPQEWRVVLKKTDKSSSQEINSGLRRLNSQYKKIQKFSNDIEDIEIESIEKVKNILFIDDFVGTGETAKTLFKNKERYNKVVLTYYITQEGKTNLENAGIKVYYRYIAKILDDNEIETYCEKNHPLDLTIQYEQKTMVSQFFNSSNNNYRYLYYYSDKKKENKWNPFLYRNEMYVKQRNSIMNNKKILDKFFESNKHLVKCLIINGYREKKDRYRIYTAFLEGERSLKEELKGKKVSVETIMKSLLKSSNKISKTIKFQNDKDKKKIKWYNE